jgi:hypothetical protein
MLCGRRRIEEKTERITANEMNSLKIKNCVDIYAYIHLSVH